ncbi:probable salivary secreted peptide [Vanessa cardui]|uniref:probable salivary secreted peptide n=1 Tax=Vanessa cardui TaxID=171605 RepID=UPI001F14744C|nr:probable salivary secreted peptide [Vanessa cardui]
MGHLMMKYLLPLFLLALVLACNAAVVPDVSSQDISVGAIRPGDRLLHKASFQVTFQDRVFTNDFTFNGINTNEISAVFVTEVDKTPLATAWITDGGVGFKHVTIKMKSYYPYGSNFAIEIWGN